jgi:hypothetical protein
MAELLVRLEVVPLTDVEHLVVPACLFGEACSLTRGLARVQVILGLRVQSWLLRVLGLRGAKLSFAL